MKQIYKKDTTGKTRVWSMERQGNLHRTHAGVLGGAVVTSGWTECVGKQGRTDDEQAQFEVDAAYTHKLTREYHESLDTISQGAHYFKPMLAQSYAEFHPGYAQPKLDGVRCIATRHGLFTRQGKPIVSCPHIVETLRPAFEAEPDLILDGELYNHELKDDFNQLISLIRKQKLSEDDLAATAKMVQYHVYDVPSLADCWFPDRMCYLRGFMFKDPIFEVVTYPAGDQAEYDSFHAEWLGAGYEGSMWRSVGGYEQKRSKNLQKRKEFKDAEFEVVSIEAGVGNWAGLAKSVTCRLPDGRTFGAGIKGNQARARALLDEDHKVVTIKYFELTPDGIPRFGIATHFHGHERTM